MTSKQKKHKENHIKANDNFISENQYHRENPKNHKIIEGGRKLRTITGFSSKIMQSRRQCGYTFKILGYGENCQPRIL